MTSFTKNLDRSVDDLRFGAAFYAALLALGITAALFLIAYMALCF